MVRINTNTIGKRTLQTAGILLTGVLLTSCGEASHDINAPVPSVQKAQTRTEPPATGATGPSAPQALPQNESTARQNPSTGAAAAQGGRCHTSLLSGTLQQGEPGAGQRYAELTLRNDSASACTLYGYGGLELVGADGQPLPTNLKRTPNPGPTLVRLAPGESASATLHWSAVPYDGEPVNGPCQPVPATARVIPPDETDPLTVKWNLGSVCGFGSIDGSAYHR